VSEERARASFGVLLPGDVLVHRSNEKDVTMVVRVGQRLDFKQLIDGRYLEAWVPASAEIPKQYTVVRGSEVVVQAA
jgi:hypothetical protein